MLVVRGNTSPRYDKSRLHINIDPKTHKGTSTTFSESNQGPHSGHFQNHE